MNKALIAFWFIALLSPLSTSPGGIVIVDLPEFVGTVSSGEEKTTSFDVGLPFNYINNIHLYLAGTVHPGTGRGDGVERPIFPYFDWWGSLSVGIVSPPEYPYPETCSWKTAIDEEGSFTIEQLLTWPISGMCPAASYDFLLDGQGEASIYLHPYFVIGGIMMYPPSATITEASLIIDGSLDVLHAVSPQENERLISDTTYTIEWNDLRVPTGCSGNYLLYYSLQGSGSWTSITSQPVTNICSYEWKVPSAYTQNCLIKVIDADDTSILGISAPFKIFDCQGPLKGDLDNNGHINISDYAWLTYHWLDNDCSQNNQWCDGSDINQTGTVDLVDLYYITLGWLIDCNL